VSHTTWAFRRTSLAAAWTGSGMTARIMTSDLFGSGRTLRYKLTTNQSRINTRQVTNKLVIDNVNFWVKLNVLSHFCFLAVLFSFRIIVAESRNHICKSLLQMPILISNQNCKIPFDIHSVDQANIHRILQCI